MTYKEFFIHKQSGTYAETLEAFGLAKLLNEILQRSGVSGRKITIEDRGSYYLVNCNKEITDEMLDALGYFQIVKFILKSNHKYDSKVYSQILQQLESLEDKRAVQSFQEVKKKYKSKDDEYKKAKKEFDKIQKEVLEKQKNYFLESAYFDDDLKKRLTKGEKSVNSIKIDLDLAYNSKLILESGIDIFNFPEQEKERNNYFEERKKVKEEKKDNYQQALKQLEDKHSSEFGNKIDYEFDVYREIKKNPYSSFLKVYFNFFNNKEYFNTILKYLFAFYSQSKPKALPKEIELFKRIPFQQLYTPDRGKGLNRQKADGSKLENASGYWYSETMRISGALLAMKCQQIKMDKQGQKWDIKLFVPEFQSIQISKIRELVLEFKKYSDGNAPIKVDVLNTLRFIEVFIKLTPEYKGKIRNTVKGFYNVYQKQMNKDKTKPKTVMNLAFINTPDFVAYTNKQEGKEWIDILKSQRDIISAIEEMGDSVQGLQQYRNFLGSAGQNALMYFNRFSYWYASHLMSFLSGLKSEQENSRAYFQYKSFQIETLNKFYKNMDNKELNLSEIIINEGFKAVASAIRKSTVSLQYTPKESRKFEIRYGLAQQLQNKSKSKEDLATFIGEFIGTYNAETARNAEKNNGKPLRANVKDEELIQFYSLLDKNPAHLIGAFLASYGFALNKKETPETVVNSEEGLTESKN